MNVLPSAYGCLHDGLLSLPDAVLVKVLAYIGLTSTAHTACTCKRLHEVVQQLRQQLTMQQFQVFASAGSQQAQLPDAIHDAARRACEGMQGGVDFAVLFISGYARQKALRTTDEQANLAAGGPAALLQRWLPEGVPVVGCTVDGVMSVANDNSVMEVDPSARYKAANGVAMLLGRMPGYCIKPFVDMQWAASTAMKTGGSKTMTAAKNLMTFLAGPNSTPAGNVPADGACSSGSMQQGAGPATGTATAPGSTPAGRVDQEVAAATPQLVWLFSSNRIAMDMGPDLTEYAAAAADGRQMCKWICKQWQDDVVLSGGIVAGQTQQLFFAPGNTPLPAVWTARDVERARYAGLAVCKTPKQDLPTAGGATAGPSSTPSTTLETARHPASAFAHAGATSGASLPVPLVVPAVTGPAPGLRAAAGALLGLGPAPVDGLTSYLFSVTHMKLKKNTAQHFDASMPYVLLVKGMYREQGHLLSMAAHVEAIESGDVLYKQPRMAFWLDGTSGDMTTFEKAVMQPDCGMLLVDPDQVTHFVEDDEELHYGIDDCELAKAQRLVRIWREREAWLRCGHGWRILALTQCRAFAAGRKVRAQLVDCCGPGCEQQSPPLLQVLRSACTETRAPEAAHNNAVMQELHAALSANAHVVGARSGPCCAMLVSCNGRGAAVLQYGLECPTPMTWRYKQKQHKPEACITDEVLAQQVPFVGGFFAGEIGPTLSSRWTSLCMTQAAIRQLHTDSLRHDQQVHQQQSRNTMAVDAAEDTMQEGDVGDVPAWLQTLLWAKLGSMPTIPGASSMQAYTTMYSMMG